MLTFVSLLYLSLPYFLFAAGWFWWPYAVVLSGVMAAALFFAWRVCRRREQTWQWSELWPRGRDGVLLLVITLLMLVPAGSGGIGRQRDDWRKNNAVLHDLATSPWPVVAERTVEG